MKDLKVDYFKSNAIGFYFIKRFYLCLRFLLYQDNNTYTFVNGPDKAWPLNQRL